MDTLIAIRKAESKLQRAADYLSSDTNTTDELINENANNFRKNYLALSLLLEESAVQNEQLMKSQNEAELAEFISESSKTAVNLDETWKLLPVVVAQLSQFLVDTERTVDDKLMYLKISRSEREELIKSLDNVFGSEIKNGMKPGQLAVVASGALFRGFLTSEWKSSDE